MMINRNAMFERNARKLRSIATRPDKKYFRGGLKLKTYDLDGWSDAFLVCTGKKTMGQIVLKNYRNNAWRIDSFYPLMYEKGKRAEPKRQGVGIGTLRLVTQLARKKGLKEIVVTAWTPEGRDFYLGMGFKSRMMNDGEELYYPLRYGRESDLDIRGVYKAQYKRLKEARKR